MRSTESSTSGASLPDLPDQALVALCLSGQPQVYRLLYRRHQAKVRAMLHQLCSQDNLDDLMQEVFLRAWKGLPRFRQQAQFSTWLYRIVWNVACDHRQHQAKHRTQLASLQQAIEAAYPPPSLLHLHYQDLVQRGLQALSLEQRAVLVLHDLEQLPQREIAAILEIPAGTVKSRLFYARAAMRQYFEQAGVQL